MHNRCAVCSFVAVITAQAWRAGQKAVLRELGPNKLPRAGRSPPTRDVPQHQHNEPTESHPDTAKGLSDEAKSVLADLHSGNY